MGAEVLERRIVLACSPGHAFDVFTTRTDLWWPRHHRRTASSVIIFEPATGGRLLERASDGEEWVLGRITAYDPPGRLSFDWYPGSPLAPTAVDVAFGPAPGGAEIAILHRALSEGAIAAWPGKVALFERGWDTILPALGRFITASREWANGR
jgi:uncharacterized protein YndB with AHSA1/START domain